MRDKADYFAHYDDLVDHPVIPIDVSQLDVWMSATELQYRAIFHAVETAGGSNCAVAQVLYCPRFPRDVERRLDR